MITAVQEKHMNANVIANAHQTVRMNMISAVHQDIHQIVHQTVIMTAH